MPIKHIKEFKMTSSEEFLAALLRDNKTNGSQSTLRDALAELDSMIGLASVKQQIYDLVNIVKNKGTEHIPCLHMIFTGNPGTGKTEVARILGKVFCNLDVLPNSSFTEIDRSDLVAEYVGQTAPKAKKVIESAFGGVLFIDEAYSLGAYNNLGGGLEGGSRNDFGPEAIDVLVKQMEDRRSDFICIMAGYPKEMEAMIRVNPGLRDRIGFTIDFPNYNAAELALIFEKMIADAGYKLTDEALKEVVVASTSFAEIDDPTFGNARFIRKLVERVIFKQNVRSADDVIEVCDVMSALDETDFSNYIRHNTCSPVGFCTA